MKYTEIRELSDAELATKLDEGRAELFNLRFQMATSQLDNTARVRQVKKDIARSDLQLGCDAAFFHAADHMSIGFFLHFTHTASFLPASRAAIMVLI